MSSEPVRVFLSHSSSDSNEVLRVAAMLSRQPRLELFVYEEHQIGSEHFEERIQRELNAADAYLIFVGDQYLSSNHQRKEVNEISRIATESSQPVPVFTVLLGSVDIQKLKGKDGFNYPLVGRPILNANHTNEPLDPMSCAREFLEKLRKEFTATGPTLEGLFPFHSRDGLPANPHLFDYEKDIIQFFYDTAQLGSKLFKSKLGYDDLKALPNPWSKLSENEAQQKREEYLEKLHGGCPSTWPEVRRIEPHYPNPVLPDDIGTSRPDSATVNATSLTSLSSDGICLFPEAGPREDLAYPLRNQRRLKVGVLVSGGIAPGINAVLDGIVQRHDQYVAAYEKKGGRRYSLTVTGFRNGFQGLLNQEREGDVEELDREKTGRDANRGGSSIGTARLEDLLLDDRPIEKRDHQLAQMCTELRGIDILYIIGGDGSMKAAHALSVMTRDSDRSAARPLAIVGIPKTMDNDILWVWQSFGFLSAVEKAREFVEDIHVEVQSNPRLCVMQLFGSDSGFVVSHSVLASPAGSCDLALIPEEDFSMKGIAAYLRTRIVEDERTIPYGLVVMAENAIPLDAMEYVDLLDEGEEKALRAFEGLRKKKGRIQGQTSDALRRAGLKIVSKGLERLLKNQEAQPTEPDWNKLRVFVNEPRHLVRAIPPSTTDIIMGQRLGMLAVDQAMAGYHDFMISQWGTEFVLVPLELVILGRKRIPTEGIFWKSVRAKTRQPKDLVSPWRSAGPGTVGTLKHPRPAVPS